MGMGMRGMGAFMGAGGFSPFGAMAFGGGRGMGGVGPMRRGFGMGMMGMRGMGFSPYRTPAQGACLLVPRVLSGEKVSASGSVGHAWYQQWLDHLAGLNWRLLGSLAGILVGALPGQGLH
jgi:hypothetical protein